MHLLRLVWGGAAAGILQMLFLPKAPRLLTTLIYIALGWVIVPHATEVCQDADIEDRPHPAVTIFSTLYAPDKDSPSIVWC